MPDQPRPTHPQLVLALCKPDSDIHSELSPGDCHLWHMSSALMGEAGELFDAIKKMVIYRKHMDRANIVEELGDIEFYLEGLRQGLEIPREEVLEANIAKLTKRYGSTYSNKSAQTRADKDFLHG